MLLSFTLNPDPISIHGQANDLVNLIQQHILCYIILDASHHLLRISRKIHLVQ
jgi:hypothetical protein